MNLKGLIANAVESIHALRTASPGTRAVLDMTGDEIALIVPNGDPRVIRVGSSIEAAAVRVAKEIPPRSVVNCVLSARMVTVRRWPVPNIARGKVRRIIEARIKAEMPLMAGELVWAYDLQNTPSGRLAVAYLVKRRYAERIAEALESTGLIPGHFENEPSLLLDSMAVGGRPGAVLILRRLANVGLLIAGDEAGAKQVYKVGADEDSSEWIDELARRWAEKSGASVDGRLFFLTSADAGLQERALKCFGLKPRKLVVKAPPILSEAYPAAAVSLKPGRGRLSLNPFASRLGLVGRSKEFIANNIGLVAGACAFVLLVCGVFDIAMARITSGEVASSLREARRAAMKLDKIQQKTEMLKVMSRVRYDLAGVMFGTAEAGRAGLKFEEIACRGQQLIVKGQASSTAVEKFLQNLKAYPGLSSAELVSIRGNRFEVKCRLNAAGSSRFSSGKGPSTKPAGEKE